MACVILTDISSQEMLLSIIRTIMLLTVLSLLKVLSLFLSSNMFYLFQKLSSRLTAFIKSSQINPFTIRTCPCLGCSVLTTLACICFNRGSPSYFTIKPSYLTSVWPQISHKAHRSQGRTGLLFQKNARAHPVKIQSGGGFCF